MYCYPDCKCTTANKTVIHVTWEHEYWCNALPGSRCYRERERDRSCCCCCCSQRQDETRLGSQIGMQGACALGSVYCRIHREEKRGQAGNKSGFLKNGKNTTRAM